MASKEVRGSFCRYDSCVITDQLATGTGALERELLLRSRGCRRWQLVGIGGGITDQGVGTTDYVQR